jgi:hypothetical protein
MADPKQGIEGNVAGKSISPQNQQKIQDVLKTTLQAELTSAKPTVGTVVGGRHGSITHGSVIFDEV